jgi:hypothetical protein
MSELIHVTDLTHTVFGLCKKEWQSFLKVLAWLLIPAALLAILPVLPLPEILFKIIENALALITVLISLWLSVMLIDMFLHYTKGKPVIRKRHGKTQGLIGRIIDLIVVSIIQSIIVGVWFLPWAIPALIAWTKGIEAALQSTPILFVIGIVLLVPGLLLANWFSFARYTVLVDGSVPWKAAFKMSRALVFGRFWKIAWRWIGAYLYFGSLLLLGTLAFLALLGAIVGNPGAVLQSNPVWWVELVETVVTILATPLFVGVGVLLYQDAKRTK